ncbi:hypothetical protein BC827DRAFT_1382321 [Russula dissimulans]|nr:hypothetical protein BC827DRAFT_1382321 [Russula dissimulans]
MFSQVDVPADVKIPGGPQVERAQASRAPLGMQARLGESPVAIRVKRKARLQLEHILAEISKKVRRCSPCKCGERLVCIFVFKSALVGRQRPS